MSAKTIQTQVTISRNSSDEIHIEVIDQKSKVRFVRVKLTPHDLAMALTGLSMIDTSAEVVGLDVVGKLKVSKSRTVECPLDTHDRVKLRDWLEQNCQEDGWFLDSFLGAQSSVGRSKDGGVQLNYRVYRYVEQDAAAHAAQGGV